MQYAYTNRLGQKPAGLDPDAKAYINAVIAAGATVSGTQENAISNFVKTGKADGWYTSIKRLYLPIWGAAAPCAVDMISGTSGTYNNTPTFSSSTVEFVSGSSQNFDSGTSFFAQGLTSSSGYLFALVTAWTGIFVPLFGAGATTSETRIGRTETTNLQFRYSGSTEGQGRVTATGNDGTLGIVSASRQGGNRKIYIRTNSGRSEVATLTSADAGSIPESNVYFAGTNNATPPGASSPVYTTCTLGLFGFGLGLTDSQDSAFTAALETLWETCTGSTIP